MSKRKLVNTATQSPEGDARNRERIAAARDFVRRLREDAAEGLGKTTLALAEQIEGVSERLERGARLARTTTRAMTLRAQESLAEQVRSVYARALLALAETKAEAARTAMLEQRFADAESLLDETAELIRRIAAEPGEARQIATIERIGRATREAAASLRTHAELTAKKTDRLMAESDRLLASVKSGRETVAAAAEMSAAGV